MNKLKVYLFKHTIRCKSITAQCCISINLYALSIKKIIISCSIFSCENAWISGHSSFAVYYAEVMNHQRKKKVFRDPGKQRRTQQFLISHLCKKWIVQSMLYYRNFLYNYEVQALWDLGTHSWSSYLLKQEGMTPTADCLIIYNACCTLCETFYNDSLWEHCCEES